MEILFIWLNCKVSKIKISTWKMWNSTRKNTFYNLWLRGKMIMTGIYLYDIPANIMSVIVEMVSTFLKLTAEIKCHICIVEDVSFHWAFGLRQLFATYFLQIVSKSYKMFRQFSKPYIVYKTCFLVLSLHSWIKKIIRLFKDTCKIMCSLLYVLHSLLTSRKVIIFRLNSVST